MAPLRFSRVLSYSSEEPAHPATGLLAKGKWVCREEGEAEAWVILQLEETSVITDIDIGNQGAAFIEGQVGREPSQFSTLLAASSFMSPGEARVGEQTGRVRMFPSTKLCASVVGDKWDLVRVVATQPFTRHARYGLAFITVSGRPA